MSKGKILLTGHHGYIGSVMGPWFIGAGYDVVGLDTVYYDEDCGFSTDAGPMTEVHKDIRDLTADDVPTGRARLILLGGMNASVEWFDPAHGSLDDLAEVVTRQFWSGLAGHPDRTP